LHSWFFLSFPATWILVAGPEGDEERSGEEVLRLIQIRLTTASLEKSRPASQDNSPQRTGSRFQFQKRPQLFIRVHNKAISVVAVCVCNKDWLPVGIDR